MTDTASGEDDEHDVGGREGGVRVKCSTDAGDLGVDWTHGAIFEFESVRAAERWLADQNDRVHGTLFLARVPEGAEELAVDFYVKYTAVKT